MSNSTEDDGSAYLWKYTVYILEGGTTSLFNIILFLTLLRYFALRTRKECVVLLSQALADGLNGAAYFICGIYRFSLVMSGTHAVLVSHWECMMKPHNLIWAFSDSIASLMLAVSSLDRFLSVSMPLRYIGWPLSYSYSLVGIAYGYTAFTGLYGIYVSSTLSTEKQFPSVCFTSMAIGPLYSTYLSTFYIFGLLSILFYIMIYVAYIKKKGQTSPMVAAAAKQELKRQKKITRSLALSCVFTFFLFVLPMMMNSLSTAVDYSATGLTVIPLYAFMWSNLNPLLNVLIVVVRHREVRYAMKCLFVFKELPNDTRLWNMEPGNSQASKSRTNRRN